MTKQLLSVALSLAVVSQGVARANEPAPADVTVVHDRAALAVHLDALEPGDRVVVATDEGVVSGELVDKDADEMVIDQPLIEGGAERIVVSRREIQGVRYQPSAAAQTRVPVKALVTVAVVVGILLGIATMVGKGLGGP
jgi:hypothetical protein